MRHRCGLVIAGVLSVAASAKPPTVIVTHDDTIIDQSCIVEIPPGTVIADTNGDGVIHVRASGIEIDFRAGKNELRLVPPGTPPETISGIGIRVDGQHRVTIRGARLLGCRIGIWATDADGLIVQDCDVSEGFAQRLGSTPDREDPADWLWPHENDKGEWAQNYGAGILIEESKGVIVRRTTARRRQNGIMLSRVSGAQIYDNDCSFLSGWGLAMWRSSDNLVSRNAFDFCVRGFSPGKYNRGQDSAGILMFEQCSDNIIIENSATHSGDGLFAFAGKEALGETPPPNEGFSYRRRGNNNNLFMGNDFSDAVAHGLELTFSFDNQIWNNRFARNGICGIWAGYSQDTLIAGNSFEQNGQLGYGLERGGINIEHGANNTIRNNSFRDNRCGIHLWDDDDEGILALPWARANHKGSIDNLITENRFDGDELAIHLREDRGTVLLANRYERVKEELRTEASAEVLRTGMLSSSAYPQARAIGATRPVGARTELDGRDAIVMGAYFPWDHTAPMLRLTSTDTGMDVWELIGAESPKNGHSVVGDGVRMHTVSSQTIAGKHTTTFSLAGDPGVRPYTLRVRVGSDEIVREGLIITARWRVRVFPLTTDPREDRESWDLASTSDQAIKMEMDSLDLRYAKGGPTAAGMDGTEGIGPDHFGTLATTTIEFPAGRWRITTLSDDGVRVLADGEIIIDNWTWHGPTRDTGIIELAEARAVELVVEHFELDGYAVLSLQIEPIK